MKHHKFAAHYMLSPQGDFIKWPVITIRNDGLIIDINHHKQTFIEQHGVKFYSGILLPPFMDIWWDYSSETLPIDDKSLTTHFNNGTILLGLSNRQIVSQNHSHHRPRLYPHRFPYNRPEIFPDMGIKNSLPILEKIKIIIGRQKNLKLHQILSAVTSESAIKVGQPCLGRLETGCSPGIILIENADLINLKLNPHSSVKWLIFPTKESG
ncbi:hypothetical protein [Thermophagus xiamenensis]|jgi:hypothetical protein|uniref:Uncharacterized protein n=1 Tax=Thermophagus xiamenensis TaxID=385682 RepID=A0A1I2DIR8_9BACT|nr:hypothetical protein [Thermophagus xiamenensis]SFE80123.1 hypothetical protein SAMN05444380_11912 [Thermophagus xiamenensis]